MLDKTEGFGSMNKIADAIDSLPKLRRIANAIGGSLNDFESMNKIVNFTGGSLGDKLRLRELMSREISHNQMGHSPYKMPIFEKICVSKEYVEGLKRDVQNFQSKIGNDRDVLLIVMANNENFLVSAVRWREPDVVVFEGKDKNGFESELVLQKDQISFIMKAIEKESDQIVRKIGFHTD